MAVAPQGVIPPGLTRRSRRSRARTTAAACALVLGPFAYLSSAPTLAEGQQELCGPSGALCEIMRHGSWVQWLVGIGPRTLGETGLPANVLDPEQASAHIRLLVENGVLGWLAVCWVLVTALTALFRAQRDVRDPALRALLWACSAPSSAS